MPRPLGPLPRAHQLLTSQSTVQAHYVDEAQQTISRIFCEHELSPLEAHEVEMTLRSVQDDGVGLQLLDYGKAVRIGVNRGLESFHLVQIPLSGHASLRAGKALVQSSSEVATIPPIDRGFVMHWGHNTPTLIVYVSRDRLRAVARAMYQIDTDQLQLGLQLQLRTVAGIDFLRSLIEYHDILERHTADTRYARKLGADLLLARLLNALDNHTRRGAESQLSENSTLRSDALVRRFEAAAEAAAVRGVGVLDIATELGVPLRTLQSKVRVFRNSTPTAILKEAQLRHARELLLTADPQRDTVTRIATASGFAHLGRFASEYRSRFGESPVETLRR